MIAFYFLIIILLVYKYLDSREKKKRLKKRKRTKFLLTIFRFIHIEKRKNYVAIIIEAPEFTIPKL